MFLHIRPQYDVAIRVERRRRTALRGVATTTLDAAVFAPFSRVSRTTSWTLTRVNESVSLRELRQMLEVDYE